MDLVIVIQGPHFAVQLFELDYLGVEETVRGPFEFLRELTATMDHLLVDDDALPTVISVEDEAINANGLVTLNMCQL